MHDNAFEQLATLEREHWWFRGRRTVYLEILRSQLREAPSLALDLGAGSGGWLPALSEIAQRVVAVEPDAQAAAIARNRDCASVLTASAYRLPLADNSCDLITAFDVIEHLDDDLAALREARRVLSTGGLFMLSVPAHPWLFSNNDRISHHRRRYTRRALKAQLERAGLVIERLTYTNALLFPLIAPTVIGIKALERLKLFGQDPDHTNLSVTPPGLLSELCYQAFALERHWSKHSNLPFGHSLLALVRANTTPDAC